MDKMKPNKEALKNAQKNNQTILLNTKYNKLPTLQKDNSANSSHFKADD